MTDARLTLAGTNVTLRMGTALPAKEESEGMLMVSIPQKDDKGQLVITMLRLLRMAFILAILI